MTSKRHAGRATPAAARGRLPRRAGRRRARSARRGRSARDCRTWLHLLDRLDADDGEPGGDDDGDAAHQREPRAGQRRVGGENKAQCRLVPALVPQQVELRRDLLQIERDAVRLVRLGRALDEPRPLRQLANQRELGRIGEPVERRLGQRRVGQIVRAGTPRPRGASPRRRGHGRIAHRRPGCPSTAR